MSSQELRSCEDGTLLSVKRAGLLCNVLSSQELCSCEDNGSQKNKNKKHGFTPVDECDITYTTPPLWEITKSAGALVNVYV